MNTANYSYRVSPQKWSEIRHQIRSKWDKLEIQEIESLKINLELLGERLQASYGYSKSFAVNEFHRFVHRLPEWWFTRISKKSSE